MTLKFLHDKAFAFHAWAIQDKQRALIMMQWLVMGILLFIASLLWLGWRLAPKEMVVYLPPDISKGSLTHPMTVPPAYVYAFSFELWQSLNDWPDSGEQDYLVNLKKHRALLSPTFYQDLIEDNQSRLKAGELSRTRSIAGLHGQGFEKNAVKRLDENSWAVQCKVRLREYVAGVTTKDVAIVYTLKVTRLQSPTESNPYGLVLDGFVHAPKRLTGEFTP